jgi:uncharacterized membrane protein
MAVELRKPRGYYVTLVFAGLLLQGFVTLLAGLVLFLAAARYPDQFSERGLVYGSIVGVLGLLEMIAALLVFPRRRIGAQLGGMVVVIQLVLTGINLALGANWKPTEVFGTVFLAYLIYVLLYREPERSLLI